LSKFSEFVEYRREVIIRDVQRPETSDIMQVTDDCI
jgi:hypothetical protein